MKKHAISAILLAVALVGCTASTPQPNEPPAATTVLTPQTTAISETTLPNADPLAEKIAASGERWLEVGYACFRGEIPLTLDMNPFFAEAANLSYLTLFDDMFFLPDADTVSVQVAGRLFAFIVTQYGEETLFDLEQRQAIKDAFVKSYNPTLRYANAFEALGAAMDCRIDVSGRCTILLEGAEYDFALSLLEQSASSVHSLIYYNVLARQQLIPLLRELDGTGELFTLDGTLHYTMALGGGASSTDPRTRVMTVNHFSAMLHETVHALGLFPKTDDQRWFVEGLCEYFGRALDFDMWLNLGEWQETAMALQGRMDSLAAQPQWARRIAAAEHYAVLGGKVDSVEAFSMATMLHAHALADAEIGNDETLGAAFAAVNGKPYPGQGGELTYAQAASMVLYLAERDGIEVLLEQYRQGKSPDLGETYSAWESWLRAEKTSPTR